MAKLWMMNECKKNKMYVKNSHSKLTVCGKENI